MKKIRNKWFIASFAVIGILIVTLATISSYGRNNPLSQGNLTQNQLDQTNLNNTDSSILPIDKVQYDLDKFTSGYDLNSDYTLEGNLDIVTNDNFTLLQYQVPQQFDTLSSALTSIGLTNFAQVRNEGKYLWTEPNSNGYTSSSNQLYIELQNNFMKFIHEDGIRLPENSVKGFLDFFKLIPLGDIQFTKKEEMNDRINQQVYHINFGENNMTLFNTEGIEQNLVLDFNDQGKLVSAYSNVIFFGELKNTENVTLMENINSNSLIKRDKKFIYNQESTSTSSHAGIAVFLEHTPVQANLESYSFGYLQIFTQNLESFILHPIIRVSGNFVDTENNIGNYSLIIL